MPISPCIALFSIVFRCEFLRWGGCWHKHRTPQCDTHHNVILIVVFQIPHRGLSATAWTHFRMSMGQSADVNGSINKRESSDTDCYYDILSSVRTIVWSVPASRHVCSFTITVPTGYNNPLSHLFPTLSYTNHVQKLIIAGLSINWWWIRDGQILLSRLRFAILGWEPKWEIIQCAGSEDTQSVMILQEEK